MCMPPAALLSMPALQRVSLTNESFGAQPPPPPQLFGLSTITSLQLQNGFYGDWTVCVFLWQANKWLVRGRGGCWLHEGLHTGFVGQALACASLRCRCTSLTDLPCCYPPAAATPGEPEPERQQLLRRWSHCRQSAACPQAPHHAASSGPQPLQAQVGRRRVSAGCPAPHPGCCQQCILHLMYCHKIHTLGACLPSCSALPTGPYLGGLQTLLLAGNELTQLPRAVLNAMALQVRWAAGLQALQMRHAIQRALHACACSPAASVVCSPGMLSLL
jgi:hypothetical protein